MLLVSDLRISAPYLHVHRRVIALWSITTTI